MHGPEIEHVNGPSLRSGAVRVVARAVLKPALTLYPTWGPATRLMPVLDVGARLLPRLPSTEHEPVRGTEWVGELVRPRGSDNRHGAILYLHGGAFLFCGLATHRRIVERLAVKTGVPVLSVAYRQMPQGRLADSIADSLEAFGWLVEQGFDPGSIVVAGDSAGGHLAFAVSLQAPAVGLGTPGGIVALSPWLDFDDLDKRAHPNARKDHYIPTRRLRRITRMVTGVRRYRDLDPLHSPVNADVRHLPPTLLVCAADEVLRVDAEKMAGVLGRAGVPVRLQVWEGQVHAFPVMGHLIPESRAALDHVADFVHERLAGQRRVRRVA